MAHMKAFDNLLRLQITKVEAIGTLESWVSPLLGSGARV